MSSVYTSANSTLNRGNQQHPEPTPTCRGSSCKLDSLFGTLGRKKKQIREGKCWNRLWNTNVDLIENIEFINWCTVEELEEEGKHAIDGPSIRPEVDKLLPSEYQIGNKPFKSWTKPFTQNWLFSFKPGEAEERKIIEPSYLEEKRFQSLLNLLKNWVNDELRYGESGLFLEKTISFLGNKHIFFAVFNASSWTIWRMICMMDKF